MASSSRDALTLPHLMGESPAMSLALPFTIVGTATLTSRVTGFIRDILIAAILGTGPVADIYVAAFLIPNLIRRMMSEGALNAAIVPRLARLEQVGGKQAARGFSDELLSLLSVGVILLVAVGQIAMPAIMSALAYGFRADGQKFADAVLFARIVFPFVGLIIFAALVSTLLNAVERYAVAALVPVVLNLLLIGVMIALLVAFPVEQRQAGLVLISTVLAAGFVQLALLWWAAAREGFDMRPRPLDALAGRIDPAAKAVLILALPGMVIAGSGHVHMIIASQFASLEPRGMAWLYFADRLFQLPLGFVASAVGIVLLPRLSRALNQGDEAGMAAAQSEALVFSALLILPAMMGLYLLAKPIAAILFQRAAFVAEDARMTGAMLKILALALPAFVLVKVILPFFLAREEMRIPILAVILALCANIAGALYLREDMPRLAAVWGVTIGAWANAGFLIVAAWSRMLLSPKTFLRLAAIALATGVMGLAVGWLSKAMKPWLAPDLAFLVKGGALAGICLAGLMVFMAVSWILGAFRFAAIRKLA